MKKKSPILLVEDEPDVCRVIQSYFGRRGVDIRSTSSGKEALALIKTLKPVLVLLDLSVRELNGKEVLKKLRQKDKKTNVVIITGELLPVSDVQYLKTMGIKAYLQKPLELSDLEKIVSAALKGQPLDQIDFSVMSVGAGSAHRELRHELKNTVGGLRSLCEAFVLDQKDGVYKNWTDKELVSKANEIMHLVIKKSDKISQIVDKIV